MLSSTFHKHFLSFVGLKTYIAFTESWLIDSHKQCLINPKKGQVLLYWVYTLIQHQSYYPYRHISLITPIALWTNTILSPPSIRSLNNLTLVFSETFTIRGSYVEALILPYISYQISIHVVNLEDIVKNNFCSTICF